RHRRRRAGGRQQVPRRREGVGAEDHAGAASGGGRVAVRGGEGGAAIYGDLTLDPAWSCFVLTLLREHGVPQDQAEAHAEAIRHFIMAELVRKSDLTLALEAQTLELTVRLGLMLATAITVLGAVLKLT